MTELMDILSKRELDRVEEMRTGTRKIDTSEWRMSMRNDYLFRVEELSDDLKKMVDPYSLPMSFEIPQLSGDTAPSEKFAPKGCRISVYVAEDKLMVQYSLGIRLFEHPVVKEVIGRLYKNFKMLIESSLVLVVNDYQNKNRRSDMIPFDIKDPICGMNEKKFKTFQHSLQILKNVILNNWYTVPDDEMKFRTGLNGKLLEMTLFRTEDNRFFLDYRFPEDDTGLTKKERLEKLKQKYEDLKSRIRLDNQDLYDFLYEKFLSELKLLADHDKNFFFQIEDTLSAALIGHEDLIPEWTEDDEDLIHAVKDLSHDPDPIPSPVFVDLWSVLSDVVADHFPEACIRKETCPVCFELLVYIRIYG